MRLSPRSTVFAALSLLTASCIGPTNPFDPETPKELQAKATLKGHVVLEDASADDESILTALSALRVGVLLEGGERLERSGDALAVALTKIDVDGGAFLIEELVPGTYTLAFDNPPSGADAPPPTRVTLRPGTTVDVGTLTFSSRFVDGDGPGVIRGTVLTTQADAGERTVQLFRRVADRTELVAEARTAQDFEFPALPLGRYAVVAEARGFSQEYRLDLVVGDGADASITHDLSGAAALTLRPSAGVLLPQPSGTVRLRDGIAHARGDEVTLGVLQVGGVTGMRFSLDGSFLDDAGAAEPYIDLAASAVIALPDVQGVQRIYAQLEARSDSGFAFSSEIFSVDVVRDTVPPTINSVSFPLLTERGGLLIANIASGSEPTAVIDASDLESAIEEIAIEVTNTDVEPTPDAPVVVNAVPGLVRLNQAVELTDEGPVWAWFFVSDRAGNTSAATRVALLHDVTRPTQLPITVLEATGGVLRTRAVRLQFDMSALADDPPELMIVGPEPLDPGAFAVPFEEITDAFVPADLVDGGTVTFVARLFDRADNEALDVATSGSVTLSFASRVEGAVTLARGVELEADPAGTVVTVLSSTGQSLGTTATDGLGLFGIDVPESVGATVRFARPGWRALDVPAPLLPALDAGQPAVRLADQQLALAEGTVRGVFRLADFASTDDAHDGIAVRMTLESTTRAFDDDAITGGDGSYVFRNVPATAPGERLVLRAARDGYSDGLADTTLADLAVTLVNEQAGAAAPVFLGRSTFAFDVCEPGPSCAPGIFFNDDVLRIRLQDTTVTDVRVRARTAFAAADVDPPFLPFPPTNDVLVDVSGPDGPVDIFVQTRRSDGSVGDVLLATIVRDRVAPTLLGVTRVATQGAFDARFTRFPFVDLQVDADAGAGTVAPLAPSPALARSSDGTPPPPAPPPGLPACDVGAATCRVSLEGAPSAVNEGQHDVAVWACDAAGNCSAPVDTAFLSDQTPPSAAHSVALVPTGALVDVGGVFVMRSPLYGIDLEVGAAEQENGTAVVDEAGQPVADVYAVRLSQSATTAGASTQVIDPPPLAGERVDTLVAPALPAVDGNYQVFAQLFDAAGNQTLTEPNAFFVDLRIDTTGPSVALVVDDGAGITSASTVNIKVTVPPGGEVPDHMEVAADDGLFATGVQTFTFPLNPAGETFSLPANGDGSYTVFARIYDAAGNTVERSRTVVRDTTAPAILLASCVSCGASGGQLFATDTAVILSVLANDATGVSSLDVEVTDGATVSNQLVPFTGSANITLFANVDNLITVRAMDGAGNVTSLAGAASLVVLHDDVAPTLASVSLADGAAATPTAQVELTVTASDAGSGVARMRRASTLDFSAAQETEFRALDVVTLTGADGSKQVCVQVEDAAGNTAQACDTITLDATPPSGTINIVATTTNATSVNATLTYGSDTTAVAVDAGGLACATATYVPATGSPQIVPVDLEGGDGTARVFACFRDAAGNTSADAVSDTVVVDRTAPIASISVDAGADFTLDLDVGVAVSVVPLSDAVSFALATDVSPNCASASYVPFSASTTRTLPAVDGAHTIFVCVRDAAGNTSTVAGDAITLDRADPTGSVVIEGGNALARSATVGVTLTRATDVVSMALSGGALNCGTASYEAFASARTVTLTGADGTKTVSACLKDAAGRTSLFSDDIVLDRVPPVASISINGGAATTSTTNVSVGASFDADANAMALSLFPLDCASATYGALSASTAVTLLGSGGVATVFACFKDLAGNTSSVSDSILVEQASSGTLVIAIDGGAAATLDRPVVVSLVAPADATQMKVAEAATLDCASPVGYVPFASSSNVTLAVGGAAPAEGVRTISACVQTAGNQQLFSSDTILLDTFAPAGTVVIEGDAAVTNTVNVTLTIAKAVGSEDVNQIGVSDSVATACSSFEAFTSTKAFALAGGDGNRSVFVCLRDDAGNQTVVTDAIALDRAAPSPVSVDVASFVTTTTATATLTFPSPDTTQIAIAEGTLDCASTTAYVAAAASVPVPLSASEGSKVIVACFRDAAGNTSQASDITTLDLTSPTGSVLVNSGAASTTSRNVTLTVNAAQDVQNMAVVESASAPNCAAQTYVAFVQQPAFTLSVGDGSKTVQVCLEDRAGRRAAALPDSIVLDQGAPDGTIVINGGAAATNRRDVVLSITRTAGSEDALEMAVGEGALVCNAANLAYVPFAATAPFVLSSVDATKTVSLCLRDTAGNVSATTRNDTIAFDATAPTGATVAIGTGAFATSTTTSLALTFPGDVTGVAVANDGLDCTSATYAAPAATVSPFTLTTGDGTKTVVACFRDAAGNTALATDTVVLDTTPPSGVDSAVAINAGADRTATSPLSLSITAPADVTQMAVVEGSLSQAACDALVPGFVTVQSPFSLNLTNVTEGTKTASVCLRESAGRRLVVTDTIFFDPNRPTLTSFSLNGGSPTRTRAVDAVITGASTDVVSMVVLDGTITDCALAAPYVPFSSSFSWTLPAGEGPKTVSVCLKDATGNTTLTASSVTLTLDTTPPGSVAVVLNGGAAALASTALSASLAYATGAGQATQVAVAEGGIDCSTATRVALDGTSPDTAPVTTAGEGQKTVVACFFDAAGNISTAQDSIIVDTVAPKVTSADCTDCASDAGALFSTDVGVVLAFSTDESGSGVTSALVSIDGGADTAAVLTNGVLNVTLPATQIAHTVRIKAIDAAGNATSNADAKTLTITLDSVAPTATLLLQGGAARTNQSTVTATIAGAPADVVAMSVSDVTGGAALVCASAAAVPFAASFPLSFTTATEETKTVNVCLRDRAGNVTAVPVVDTVVLDTTPVVGPTLVISDAGDGFAGSITSPTAVTLTLSWLTAGEATSFKVGEGTIDCATGPYTTIAAGTTVDTTLTFSAGDGQKTATACLRDAAGNATAVADTTLLDTTAPTGSIVLAAGASFSRAAATPIAFSVPSDTTAAFVQVGGSTPTCAAVAGASFVALPSTVNLGSQGNNTVFACLRDAAGLRSAAVLSDSVILDSAAPAVSSFLVNGSASPTAASLTVTVTATATDANTPLAMALGNNALDCSTASYTTFASPVPHQILSAASTVVHLCVRDAAGNTTSTGANTVAVTLDTLPPGLPSDAVEISDGGDGFLTSATAVPVTLRWTTAGEVAGVRIAEGPIDCSSGTYTAVSSVATSTSLSLNLTAANGLKTVNACFRDAANNAATAFDQSELDTSFPTGTVSVASGATKTRLTTLVPASIVAGAQDVARMALIDVTAGSAQTCGTATYVDFSPAGTLAAFASVTDGAKTVGLCLRDTAGNQSPTPVGTDGITLDTTLSLTGVTVALTGRVRVTTTNTANTALTQTQNVTVTVAGAAADVTQLEIANESSFNGSLTSTFTNGVAVPFTLDPGDGDKDVFVRLRDDAGNTASLANANPVGTDLLIKLDTTAPLAPVAIIASGSTFTTTVSAVPVSLTAQTLIAEDAPLEVRLSTNDSDFADGGAENYTSTFPTTATFPATDGTKTLIAQFRDAAGNETAVVNDTVTFDGTAPVAVADVPCPVTNQAICINQGATVTNSVSATLQVTGSLANGGATEMQIATDGAADTEPFVPYGTTTTVLLPAGDASKTVLVRFRDAAGNVSAAAVGDSITLDTAAPNPSLTVTLSSAVGTDSSGYTTSGVVSAAFGFSPGAGEETRVKHGEGSVDCATTTGYTTLPGGSVFVVTGITLSSGDGVKTYVACFKDDAGNVTTASGQIIRDTAGPVIVERSCVDCNNVAGIDFTNGALPQLEVVSSSVDVAAVLSMVTEDEFTPRGENRTCTVDANCRTGVGEQCLPFPIDDNAPPTRDLRCVQLHPDLSNVVVSLATAGAPISAAPATPNEGFQRIALAVVDAAGNVSAPKDFGIIRDITAPGVSFTVVQGSVSNVASVLARSVSVTGEPGGTGTNIRGTFRVSALSTFADSQTYTYVDPDTLSAGFPVQLQVEGPNTVRVQVTDNAGNVGNATFAVNLDTEPPTDPRFGDGSTIINATGSVAFSALATPSAEVNPAIGSGLATPPYVLRGFRRSLGAPVLAGLACADVSTTAAECVWDGTSPFTAPATMFFTDITAPGITLEEVQRVIRVVAVDRAGNQSADDQIVVAIDNRPPSAIRDLQLTARDGQITASWVESSRAPSGYEVFYGSFAVGSTDDSIIDSLDGDFAVEGPSPLDAGAPCSNPTNPTATCNGDGSCICSMTLTGLTNDSDVYLAVRAYDEAANVSTLQAGNDTYNNDNDGSTDEADESEPPFLNVAPNEVVPELLTSLQPENNFDVVGFDVRGDTVFASTRSGTTGRFCAWTDVAIGGAQQTPDACIAINDLADGTDGIDNDVDGMTDEVGESSNARDDVRFGKVRLFGNYAYIYDGSVSGNATVGARLVRISDPLAMVDVKATGPLTRDLDHLTFTGRWAYAASNSGSDSTLHALLVGSSANLSSGDLAEFVVHNITARSILGMDAMPSRIVLSTDDGGLTAPDVRTVSFDNSTLLFSTEDIFVTTGAETQKGKVLFTGRRVVVHDDANPGFSMFTVNPLTGDVTSGAASSISDCSGMAIVPGYFLCNASSGPSLLSVISTANLGDMRIAGRAAGDVHELLSLRTSESFVLGIDDDPGASAGSPGDQIQVVELATPDRFSPVASASTIANMKSVVVDMNMIYVSTGSATGGVTSGEERLLIMEALSVDDVAPLNNIPSLIANTSEPNSTGTRIQGLGDLELSGRTVVSMRRGQNRLITIDPGEMDLITTGVPDEVRPNFSFVTHPDSTPVSFVVHGPALFVETALGNLEGWIVGGPADPTLVPAASTQRVRTRDIDATVLGVGIRKPIIDGKFLYWADDDASPQLRRIEIDDPNTLQTPASSPITGPVAIQRFASAINSSHAGQLGVRGGHVYVPVTNTASTGTIGFNTVPTASFATLSVARHQVGAGAIAPYGAFMLLGPGLTQGSLQGRVAGILVVDALNPVVVADDLDVDGTVESSEYPMSLATTSFRAPHAAVGIGATLITVNADTGLSVIRMSR